MQLTLCVGEERGTSPTETCWNPCRFFSTDGVHRVELGVGRGERRYAPDNKTLMAEERSRLATTRVIVRKPVKELAQATRLELVQLGVALAITMAALVAGAREQLERLDIGTAVAAVFALGFGADILKNLVSYRVPDRPSSSTTACMSHAGQGRHRSLRPAYPATPHTSKG